MSPTATTSASAHPRRADSVPACARRLTAHPLPSPAGASPLHHRTSIRIGSFEATQGRRTARLGNVSNAPGSRLFSRLERQWTDSDNESTSHRDVSATSRREEDAIVPHGNA